MAGRLRPSMYFLPALRGNGRRCPFLAIVDVQPMPLAEPLPGRRFSGHQRKNAANTLFGGWQEWCICHEYKILPN